MSLINNTNSLEATPSNKIANLGDIIIKDVVLTTRSGLSVSLLKLISSVEIYEDIYFNSLTGTISFIDSLALVTHAPIIGDEKISISFYTPGQDNQSHKEITLVMRVYKCTRNTVGSSDKNAFVTLDFVSPEFFVNTQIKFSASFRDMPYSEMAKKIFEDYVIKLVKQDPMFTSGPAFNSQSQETYSPVFLDYKTEGNKTVVFPYWSPFYAINWLANRSHSIVDNKFGCDYLFFQQLNGTYNFVPLSYFKTKDVVASYTRIPSDKTREMMQYKNIQEFTILNYADKMRDVSSGVYASSYKAFDITKKTIDMSLFNYFNTFYSTLHTEDAPTTKTGGFNRSEVSNPLITKESFSFGGSQNNGDVYSTKLASYTKILPKKSNKFGNSTNYKHDSMIDNEGYENYALIRQSLMNQLNTVMVQIKVLGDSRRRIGDIVELLIPSMEDPAGVEQGFEYDRYLSGNYMITKINHAFTHNNYELIMTLVKDSYSQPLSNIKQQGETFTLSDGSKSIGVNTSPTSRSASVPNMNRLPRG
jgi:hypothetical protein